MSQRCLPMSLGDHWKVDKSGNFRVFFLPSWRGSHWSHDEPQSEIPGWRKNTPLPGTGPSKALQRPFKGPSKALQRPFKGPSTQIYLTSQSKGFLMISGNCGNCWQFVSHKCLIPDQFEGRLKLQLRRWSPKGWCFKVNMVNFMGFNG